MILSQVAVRTAMIFALFGCLAVTTQVLVHVFQIVDSPNGLVLALWLPVLLLPPVTVIILPLAVMIAVLQTFDRFDETMEIAVARAAGASPLVLMAPVLWLGGGLAVVVLAVSLWVEPAANRAVRQTLLQLQADAVTSFATDGVLRQVAKGLFVHAGNRDAEGRIDGLVVLDRRDRDEEVLYVARSARLLRDDGQTRLVMEDVTIELGSRTSGNRDVLHLGLFEPEASRFFDDTPMRLGVRETATSLLWTTEQSKAEANGGVRELVRRATDWLYGLALLGLAVWLVHVTPRRGHRLTGVARLLPAIGIGLVLRLAGLSVLAQVSASGPALVAAFLLPVMATAVFVVLAVRAKGPTTPRTDHRRAGWPVARATKPEPAE